MAFFMHLMYMMDCRIGCNASASSCIPHQDLPWQDQEAHALLVYKSRSHARFWPVLQNGARAAIPGCHGIPFADVMSAGCWIDLGQFIINRLIDPGYQNRTPLVHETTFETF